jgi:uncharacterized peroxidase-related enzyme
MARILPTTIETAPAATRPMLEGLKKNLGMVPALFATIGHSPEALDALLHAMSTLSHGALSAREVELVNLATSELNGCAYCVAAHGALAKRAGIDADAIEAAREARASSTREHAMLRLVARVVRSGGAGTGTELARAREAGLSDAAIVEVLAHVALKTFTNAVALVAQTEIDFPKQPRLPSL